MKRNVLIKVMRQSMLNNYVYVFRGIIHWYDYRSFYLLEYFEIKHNGLMKGIRQMASFCVTLMNENLRLKRIIIFEKLLTLYCHCA